MSDDGLRRVSAPNQVVWTHFGLSDARFRRALVVVWSWWCRNVSDDELLALLRGERDGAGVG